MDIAAFSLPVLTFPDALVPEFRMLALEFADH